MNSTRQGGKQRRGRNGCGSSCYKEMQDQQPLPSWLLQHPFVLKSSPPVPQGLPQGITLTKEWLPHTCKKKETGEEFKTFNLVEINGGLWYRVLIFTFWHKQVDKGAMPESDMTSNYIGLYKTHEDTFQIMLIPKPKRLTPKKK